MIDTWAVRGSGDLPAWGGVFILRKTYLNRGNYESQALSQNHSYSATSSEAGQNVREYVDYVVRVVRPLKITAFFGREFSSIEHPDGWLLGPNVKYPNEKYYHGDNRYGIFELNEERTTPMIPMQPKIGWC